MDLKVVFKKVIDKITPKPICNCQFEVINQGSGRDEGWVEVKCNRCSKVVFAVYDNSGYTVIG